MMSLTVGLFTQVSGSEPLGPLVLVTFGFLTHHLFGKELPARLMSTDVTLYSDFFSWVYRGWSLGSDSDHCLLQFILFCIEIPLSK